MTRVSFTPSPTVRGFWDGSLLVELLVLVLLSFVVYVVLGDAHVFAATFIGAARKRNQILGTIPNDAGQRVPRRLDLRNAGYLDRLFLTHYYDFQFGVANPTAADAFGQAGAAVDRPSLQTNNVWLLFQCSGQIPKNISALRQD